MEKIWDYIIIGAGSAGCVLAERLSADPNQRILLVEAGGRNRSPWVSIPKGIGKLVQNPRHIWTYPVDARMGDGDSKQEIWLRGKGLGGSSAINGMIWSRGEAADYDDWEAMGCEGWNGAAMAEAFQLLERGRDDARFGDSNRNPSITVSPPLFTYPLAEKMIQAGAEMGMKRVTDLNGSTRDRIGYYRHNIRHGRRHSAAHSFLDAARRRSNLTIVTGAVAERLIWQDRRAIAAQAMVKGAMKTFACRGEILVCAGTLESPLLLQRSGVGEASMLASQGVKPVIDAPDVGMRMREHLGFSMPHRLIKPVGTNGQLLGLGKVRSMLHYLATRRGIMATGPFEIGGFLNLINRDGRPDLQLYLGGYNFAIGDDKHPVPLSHIDPLPGMTIYGQLLRLTSEGSIQISGPNQAHMPVIQPNWLSNSKDQRTAVAALHAMRRLVAQPALAPLIERELLPGSQVQSDTEILNAFRSYATCGLHAVGTCRMGGDPRSVTNPRLRVRGADNVRVVDCSVIPTPVTGNSNAPVMALALRAADMIIADRK